MRLLPLILLALSLFAPHSAQAQQANLYCFSSSPPTWQPCSSANPLQTSGGGGGGGLSVTDQTAWTQGTSAFTPTGGVFNDTATLSSGQEGTVRLTTDRQMKVLDSAVLAAVQAAIPAGTNIIGATSNDPCAFATKTNVAISMQNTTAVKLVALSAAKQIYVCSLSLIASGATVFSVVDGTNMSTNCDTAAEAVIGTTTASHGLSLAANGGITYGNGGSTVARTTTAAHDLCLFQSGSVDLSGNLTYVQQ